MAAEEREVTMAPDTALVSSISKAELDQAITTARQYPRSLKRFLSECLDMATLNERIAQECIYALPRDGRIIEGPSARLAEIVASAWGNCRAGARVVEESREFVTAQGVFMDLERNVSITFEVRRRITGRDGRRFKADMIGVTGNAACSIALRNAVFKGIPKAFWSDIYDAARKVVAGDSKTIANRRAEALSYLQKLGATEPMVLAKLGVAGVEDIGLDELVLLRGLATAIKEGDTTVEEAFAPEPPAGSQPASQTARAKDALRAADPKPAEAAPAPPPPAEKIPMFSVETAITALKSAPTQPLLRKAWQDIVLDFHETKRELPLDVEAVYHDLKETLPEAEPPKEQLQMTPPPAAAEKHQQTRAGRKA